MFNIFGRGRAGQIADEIEQQAEDEGRELSHTEQYIIKDSQRSMFSRLSDPSYDYGYWVARILDATEPRTERR